MKQKKIDLIDLSLIKSIGKVVTEMKITFIFVLVVAIQLANSEVKAQDAVIELKSQSMTLKKLVKVIEQQTDYLVNFSNQEVNPNKKVNFSKKSGKVVDFLKEAFDNTGINFALQNNYIVFSKPNGQTQESSQKKRNIRGKVLDSNGLGLPGVNVTIKGDSLSGTATDIDGNYTLSATPNAMFVFSAIGMKTIELPATQAVQVTMQEDAELLDEVLVVGYGTMKKSNVTGSIASVKAEELPKVANSSVSNMLSGKASGVMVQQQSAQPGGGVQIIIRGAGSVNAGNDPLYVIDGFPVNNNNVEPVDGSSKYEYGNRNPMSSINPNDIESIEILKDASSTAIYGARAANGVVLITTKRGKEGKAKVEFSANYSVQSISKYFDMLNAKEFMIQANRIGKDKYLIDNGMAPYGTNTSGSLAYTPEYTQEQINNAGNGTDWWDEVTRQGKINEYNLTISGGTKKTKVLTSFNYFNQEGVVENSNFERFTGRINLDQEITDNINVGVSLNASYIDNGNTQLGSNEWENSGVLIAALQMDPTVPVYDAKGNYSENPKYTPLANPVSYKEIQDNTVSKRLLANTFAEWEIIKDLKVKTSLGIDDKSAVRSNYLPKTFLYGAAQGGKAYKGLVSSTDYLFNTTLNYVKNFNEIHNFNFLVGYEYQLFKEEGFGAGNSKFFTDLFDSNNLGAGDGSKVVGSKRVERALASYFGRVQYNLKEKYLASFTLRRDGATIFGENNKWGVFPSVSLGWRASEEDFMKSFDKLSNLKLRASYGQTGNSGIGDNAFVYYSSIGGYLFGSSRQTGAGKIQEGNPNLKWETTTEFNFGVDFGFFNNKIAGSFEYFDKTIDDLLAFRELPTYSPVSKVADNIGATRLKGFEFQLTTVNLDNALKWITNFNVASYKDQWEKRNNNVILAPWVGTHDPIRAIYGYKTDGVVQIGQTVAHMPTAKPGNLIYKDINGYGKDNKLTGKPDGKIDAADQVLLGSEDPGITFGLGNTFEYKGFDLNFFFYGMADRSLINKNRTKYMYDASRIASMGHNQIAKVSELFTADRPSTTQPGVAPHPNGGTNDFILEDADFIRLKNITIGYNIPRSLFNNKFDVRIFADAQNLWTITNYSGVDPETDSLGAYPNQKSFSFGVNVKF